MGADHAAATFPDRRRAAPWVKANRDPRRPPRGGRQRAEDLHIRAQRGRIRRQRRAARVAVPDHLDRVEHHAPVFEARRQRGQREARRAARLGDQCRRRLDQQHGRPGAIVPSQPDLLPFVVDAVCHDQVRHGEAEQVDAGVVRPGDRGLLGGQGFQAARGQGIRHPIV